MPHCGFTGAGHTENNYDHNALICLRLPIFSTRNATTTNTVKRTPNAKGRNLRVQRRAQHARIAELDNNWNNSESSHSLLFRSRKSYVIRNRSGIEVSEWKSQEAIDAAHRNPNVLAMWNKFFAICDSVPLKTLAEAEEVFAGFEPL